MGNTSSVLLLPPAMVTRGWILGGKRTRLNMNDRRFFVCLSVCLFLSKIKVVHLTLLGSSVYRILVQIM